MKILFREEDVQELKKLAKWFYEIYGDINDEDRKWTFQDVEDMRSIGQEFIDIVMLYINEEENA